MTKQEEIQKLKDEIEQLKRERDGLWSENRELKTENMDLSKPMQVNPLGVIWLIGALSILHGRSYAHTFYEGFLAPIVYLLICFIPFGIGTALDGWITRSGKVDRTDSTLYIGACVVSYIAFSVACWLIG